MNFSEEVKNEILKKRFSAASEKKAFLSAALKTAGTLSLTGGKIGFEISADNRAMPEVFAKYFADVYFLQAQVKTEEGKKRARYICAYLSDATEVLDDLGIYCRPTANAPHTYAARSRAAVALLYLKPTVRRPRAIISK